MLRPLRIGVSGGGRASARDEQQAEQFGAAIARGGGTLISGGLGGVMAASCRGAVAAGGVTIGVLPDAVAKTANADVAYPIVTGMGQARNVILVLTSHVLMAIGGEYGTLSEVALALKCGVPVGSLASWQPRRSGVPEPPIHAFDDAEEAAAWALEVATHRRDAELGQGPGRHRAVAADGESG